jgi:alginate O-acetyltransferase complex protein AlgI
VQRNLLNMATFVTLFPQLIAGPIVRYAQVEDELGGRTHSFDMVADGLRRFIKGLAKKVLLANQAGLIADAVFNQPAESSGTLLVWLGALAYTLQIYYDFSGYSDMAIGLGKVFGFHFPENFRHPYAARSITDFWRRWHVSLSTWFRDYVYIPLGGNRVRVGRQIFNLLLVWLLTGLWHGASWNYVLWGLYYGVLLMGEKFLWPKLLTRLEGSTWTRGLLRVGTLFLVVIGWVLFRVENLPEMVAFVTRLFVFEPTTIRSLLAAHQDVLQALPWLISGITLAFGRPNALTNGNPDRRWPWAADLLRFALLGLCLVYLVGETYNPFIYFRF